MATSDRIEVQFRSHSYTAYLSGAKENAPLFSFSEKDLVKIVFHSSRNDAHCLTIECPVVRETVTLGRFDQDIVHDTFPSRLDLNPGTQYCISDPQKEMFLFPGLYSLWYIDEYGQKHHLHYEVRPMLGMDASAPALLAKSLESFLAGLSLDVFHAGSVSLEIGPSSASLIASYKTLQSMREDFTREMTLLPRFLQEGTEAIHRLAGHPGKVDAKSVRLNATHHLPEGQSYIREIRHTFDTDLNRTARFVLQRLSHTLYRLENDVLQQMGELSASVNHAVAKANTTQNTGTKLFWTARQEENEQNHAFLESVVPVIRASRIVLKHALESAPLSQVSSVSHPLVPLAFLQRLIPVSLRLSKMLSLGRRITQKEDGFAMRPMTELFEFYGFYLIDKKLAEEGYEPIESNVGNFLDFQEGKTRFVYQKEATRIVVYYGHYCPYFFEASEAGTVSINSTRLTPDYLLEVYEDGVFQKQIVVEVK